MFQGNHQVLLWTQMLVHASLLLIVCAVFAAGWFRHRQFGYLILAAWAGVSATWYVSVQFVLPLLLATTFASSVDRMTLHISINFLSSLILTLMLLAGAYMIVFKDKRHMPE